jgi:hypothetical protein
MKGGLETVTFVYKSCWYLFLIGQIHQITKSGIFVPEDMQSLLTYRAILSQDAHRPRSDGGHC